MDNAAQHEARDTATSVLRILGIVSLLSLPRLLYASLFRGRQRMEFNNAIDIGTSALVQLGTVVILVAHGNLFQVAFWMASPATCSSTLTYMALAARYFGWITLVPGFSLAVVIRNRSFTGYNVDLASLIDSDSVATCSLASWCRSESSDSMRWRWR